MGTEGRVQTLDEGTPLLPSTVRILGWGKPRRGDKGHLQVGFSQVDKTSLISSDLYLLVLRVLNISLQFLPKSPCEVWETCLLPLVFGMPSFSRPSWQWWWGKDQCPEAHRGGHAQPHILRKESERASRSWDRGLGADGGDKIQIRYEKAADPQ